MNNLTTFLAEPVVFVIVGLIALSLSAITQNYVGKRRAALELQMKTLQVEMREAQAPLIDLLEVVLSDLPEVSRDRYIQYLLRSQREDGSFPELPIILSTTASQEEIKELVESRVSTLQARIEEIENRFPRETTLEKIASVNDAILATNLENLTESVKRIEEKMLTSWDVAKIVFLIIGALVGLAGFVLAVVRYLAPAGAV